jgi:hypothetical protein
VTDAERASGTSPIADAARLGPHAFVYEQCDVSPGLTLSQHSRQRTHPREAARMSRRLLIWRRDRDD